LGELYDPAGYAKGITSGECKLENKTEAHLTTYANKGQKITWSLAQSIACQLSGKGKRFDWVDGGLWTMDFAGENSTPANGLQNIAENVALKTGAKAWSVICGKPINSETTP
jgi:hypothetical protein